MTQAADLPADLPAWAALLTALLVLLGAGLTLTGALGLLRLDSFYKRVHAPTLGTTLGAGSILIASMIFFSALQSRPVLHEVLIALFMTVTTPVTLIFLVRAALFRDRHEAAAQDAIQDAGADGPSTRGAPTAREQD